MDIRLMRGGLAGLWTASVLLLASCGTSSTNEAPPAAPFGINVQNLNDDNNYGKYKLYRDYEPQLKSNMVQFRNPVENQRMEEGLMSIEGVRSAYVLLHGDQAYAAVTLRDGMVAKSMANPGLSQQLRDTVSKRIQAMDPTVRQVYVTDRADDIGRFETIGRDLHEGRPVTDLMQELSESVSRNIPDWSISNLTPRSVNP
ncbi:YhcN/YlaJ family sporulation lipoprotein [Gorillibacterium sp. sgz5001074]|uniref:YhcN/YlaJ family sporulation lipoprotein n=1 Tax=Gorillibacterium sp. sgz5001074 TaxID=3446695 RepID=UPI003F67E138